jgi:hypothetical protein
MRKTTISKLNGWLKMEGAECGLHPLIHTLLEFILVQDIESIKSGVSDSAVFFEK